MYIFKTYFIIGILPMYHNLNNKMNENYIQRLKFCHSFLFFFIFLAVQLTFSPVLHKIMQKLKSCPPPDL